MSGLFIKGLPYTFIPQVKRAGLIYKVIDAECKVFFTTHDYGQAARIAAGCNVAELTLQRTATHDRLRLNN